MSKYYFSSNKELTDYILENNSQHFCKYHRINDNLISFEKKIYSLGNTYIDKNLKDYVIATGTYIYKGKIGYEAAEQIFNDFNLSMIPFLKKEILGYWSIIIHKNGINAIFNDYYGIYDTLYAFYDETIIIGNSLADIALTIKNKDIDEFSFIMQCFQEGPMPCKTIFKNINKIQGNEYLLIKNKKIELSTIESKEYQIETSKFDHDKTIRFISSELLKYARIINDAFKKETIFLTGGLDSRLNFAAYNSSKSNIRCEYWTGRSMDEHDKNLVEKICNDYNISKSIKYGENPENVKKIDWKYQKLSFKELGFCNLTTMANKNQIDHIKSCAQNKEFLAFGYFCEAIRLREYAESLKRLTFSIDEYINDYFINKSLNSEVYPNYEQYKLYLREQFEQQLHQLNIDDDYDNISIDDFEKFRWKMSRYCDSRMEFLVNNYTYSFALLSIPIIHETILHLPAESIKSGKFQIEVINFIDKNLISNYDVFSHRRLFRITKNKNKVRKWTLKNFADLIIHYFPSIKSSLYTLYRGKKRTSEKELALKAELGKKYESKSSFNLNLQNLKDCGILRKLLQVLFDCSVINNKKN